MVYRGLRTALGFSSSHQSELLAFKLVQSMVLEALNLPPFSWPFLALLALVAAVEPRDLKVGTLRLDVLACAGSNRRSQLNQNMLGTC